MRVLCCALVAALGMSAGVAKAEEPITQAQARLPTAPLTITTRDGQKHEFTVELAKTYRQQEVGEMFRKHLPENEGMLFMWATPQVSDMWMRNTLVPLDIVFIDSTNHIHAIAENAVPLSEAILRSDGVVANTLELAGGVTAKLGIRVGDAVTSSALKH
ncbi:MULTISPECIES: DUF192 domain-containing protein [Gluconobacter]|uniref:DUF192 domain-containing protein n=7 Tax=Gluconobacter TaxID=441 RepID=Q5FRS5_GLUOX|nr:Hypothetical protein GOX1154 [Gluconobacter oxydans 621H]AHK71126.1 putative DUF192 family protein [Gluconobacter oxydans DSM 3504]MBF0849771.1 DUF192 domain-containing protein [Gluconobacter sp. R75690]MBF0865713.1 DUF192 domain-containing protein [Gluconobacter sp. R71656]MBF0868801.1 DUF192 domain-containing protein [Gluconobacter sp. R75628]MBF0874783.1 DUF192 domain-containing protein [Gluconobacter sp. R75629]MBF0878782.1 DUF192 domain-containing protein [Gluconobacter sp. R75828]MB